MIWCRLAFVYVTHTGRPIVYHPYTHRAHCGAMVVDLEDLHFKAPGRARQMRRMIAKAKRRLRRGGVPAVVSRPVVQYAVWKKPPA